MRGHEERFEEFLRKRAIDKLFGVSDNFTNSKSPSIASQNPCHNFLGISIDPRHPSTTRGRHHFEQTGAFRHSADVYALSPHHWTLAGLASDSISGVVLKFLLTELSYLKTSRRTDGNE